jgi:hypothetical protein
MEYRLLVDLEEHGAWSFELKAYGLERG